LGLAPHVWIESRLRGLSLILVWMLTASREAVDAEGEFESLWASKWLRAEGLRAWRSQV